MIKTQAIEVIKKGTLTGKNVNTAEPDVNAHVVFVTSENIRNDIEKENSNIPNIFLNF